VLIALAAGLFVPNANALAGAIVHPSRRGRALAIVNGGSLSLLPLACRWGRRGSTSRLAFHVRGRSTPFLGGAWHSRLKLPRDIVVNAPATLKERLAIVGQRRPLTVSS